MVSERQKEIAANKAGKGEENWTQGKKKENKDNQENIEARNRIHPCGGDGES